VTLTRLTSAVFVVVGLGMLAVAILVPDAWFQANANCGNMRNPRSPCQADEAQALLRPLGIGFAVGGVLLFGVGRVMDERPLGRSRAHPQSMRLAPATVVSVEQPQRRFGAITVSRGWCEVRLRVHPRTAPSFDARLRHSALGPPLTPETRVTVSYPADRPHDVALVSSKRG
jgi:hypothetical protein